MNQNTSRKAQQIAQQLESVTWPVPQNREEYKVTLAQYQRTRQLLSQYLGLRGVEASLRTASLLGDCKALESVLAQAKQYAN